jgi:arylsulfatase A-like enzyme
LVLNGWKLVADEQKLELYDLAADPKEQRNAYAAERARAEDMKAKLDEWNAARPQEAAPARELSGDDVEALRALGYIE